MASVDGLIAGLACEFRGCRCLLFVIRRRLTHICRRLVGSAAASRPTTAWSSRPGWTANPGSCPRSIQPLPVLGRHGRGFRTAARIDRAASEPAGGRTVRSGPVRAGAGHDQLRHVHRLEQRCRSPNATRPSRNATTCNLSAWRGWSPPTVPSRWCHTLMRATGTTRPSSPACSTRWSTGGKRSAATPKS